MFQFDVDDLGMVVRLGRVFEFLSTNGDGEQPGGFTLRVPLGPLGALQVQLDPWEGTGFEWWWIRRAELRALLVAEHAIRNLCNKPSLWDLDGPMDEELAEIERELTSGL